MSYRLDHGETIGDGVRRVAREQIQAAIDELESPEDLEASVHDVRKRCKKLRGLARLVRPELGDDYDTANRRFHDAARSLAPFRDAHALLGTFDDLVATHQELVPEFGLTSVRRRLVAAADGASRRLRDEETVMLDVADEMRAGLELVDTWAVPDSFGSLAGGLQKTYKRARNRHHDAIEEPSTEAFHEWRKRVKYHWYHMRLLRNAAPSILRPLANRLHDLSDALGDAHDLAVLTTELRSWNDVPSHEVGAAVVLADGVRTELERRSLGLGARLFAEKPGRMVDRVEGYWTAWGDLGDEPAAGEIADLWNPSDRLDDVDVDGLRELAQTVDLHGRSTLRRDELVAELRSAGTPGT